MSVQKLEMFIPHEKEGVYLTLPFTMPADTAELSLTYTYPPNSETSTPLDGGSFTARERINIIDLGLVDPSGKQVGATGSDKQAITLSANHATPGYTPHPLTPGEWQILVGAYKVAPEGVTVTYELTFTPKQRALYIGDIHTHTVASDGVLTTEELARHARRQGFDFLAVTDHNQMSTSTILNQIPGITLIPGIEWTHYRGHANFLGVDRPYNQPFFNSTDEEVEAIFQSARDRGALIVINHPCDESCGFHFDLKQFPFDCLEIWNGPMRESNLRAVGLWQTMLEAGQKIPAVGGSDYHRDHLFQILGGPCMGVYALSDQPPDILDALKSGHSFIRFDPQGPSIKLICGEAFMGDAVSWQAGQVVEIDTEGLSRGDVLRVIHNRESTDLFQCPGNGDVHLSYPVDTPGFMRVEIHRTFLPGIPPLPALISNPIYFSED